MRCFVTLALLLLFRFPAEAAEPKFSAFWIEPGAISLVARDPSVQNLELVTVESLRAMKRLGADTVILAYAEDGGVFYYPSNVAFFDRDLGREVSGKNCPFDVYGTVLAEADRLGLDIFLGTGRSGDLNLLIEFEKPDWAARNRRVIDIGKQVCRELAEKYGHHRSFVGWYLTHEMADLAKAAAHYDPLAEYCRSLGVHRKVLAAPSGTPVITTELLKSSKVDIFAYQDAVGAGYIPYEYTYQPEKRIVSLDALFSQYAKWHTGSGKEIWAVVETWEMDGKSRYSNAYPASYDRVARQLAASAPHVGKVSGYAWHGFLQQPDATEEKENPKARSLFNGLMSRADRAR